MKCRATKNQRSPTIRWLKAKEAAERFGISKSSVWRIVKKMEQDITGKYGIIRCGRIVRLREDKITEFLTEVNNGESRN